MKLLADKKEERMAGQWPFLRKLCRLEDPGNLGHSRKLPDLELGYACAFCLDLVISSSKRLD